MRGAGCTEAGRRHASRALARLALSSVALCCALATLATASASATLPTWSPTQSVDPSFTAEDFSCASSSLCIAVGRSGTGAQQLSVFNGADWSAPVSAVTATGDPNALLTLSCAPGTSFCGASDAAGNALSYSGGSWSSPVSIDQNPSISTGSIVDLSCATSTFCLGLTGEAQTVLYTGTAWTLQDEDTTGAPGVDGGGDSLYTGLSCASATLCVALGGTSAAVWNGSGWGNSTTLINIATAPEGEALTGVSCADGTQTCVAVDNGGNAYAFTVGSGVVTQRADSQPLGTVSCVAAGASAVSCVALDTDGAAVSSAAPTTAGSWGAPVDDRLAPGADPFVSCTSVSACGALDDVAFSAAAAGPTAASWTAGPPLGSGGLTAVSCAPDGESCLGTDAAGRLVAVTGNVASTPQNIGTDAPLTAISCPGAGLCLAGDLDGNVVSIVPETSATVVQSSARSVAPGDSIVAISCASTSFCEVLTSAGTVVGDDTNGNLGTATAIDSAADVPDALSCASVSFCVAVDLAGNAFTYNGASWSSAVSIDAADNGLDAVSCPSSGYCLAADAAGNTIAFNGSSWGAATPETSNRITNVSCTSSSFCQLSTSGGLEAEEDGVWTSTGSDTDVTGISCSSSAYCLAVDADGNVLSLDGPPSNLSPVIVTGDASQGGTLIANPDTWLGSPTGYTYQWLVCTTAAGCTPVSGATASTYVIPEVRMAETFEVSVSAVNAFGASVPAVSAQTATVSPLPPTSETLPAISGTVAVGRTLTASSGTWSSALAPTYTYQWYVCARTCVAIPRATRARLAVTAGDIGKRLVVVVGARTSFGTATPAASKQTAIIAAPTATLAAWVSPLLHLSGTAGRLSAIRKVRGYRATFRAAVAGTVRVTWTVTEQIAHTRRTRTLTVAAVTARTRTPSSAVKVALTRTGTALLSSRRTARITATTTFTYAYGTGTRRYRATRILTLAR